MSWPSSSNTAVACVREKLEAMVDSPWRNVKERVSACAKASWHEANCDDEGRVVCVTDS
jgi:hypothetical protein